MRLAPWRARCAASTSAPTRPGPSRGAEPYPVDRRCAPAGSRSPHPPAAVAGAGAVLRPGLTAVERADARFDLRQNVEGDDRLLQIPAEASLSQAFPVQVVGREGEHGNPLRFRVRLQPPE